MREGKLSVIVPIQSQIRSRLVELRRQYDVGSSHLGPALICGGPLEILLGVTKGLVSPARQYRVSVALISTPAREEGKYELLDLFLGGHSIAVLASPPSAGDPFGRSYREYHRRRHTLGYEWDLRSIRHCNVPIDELRIDPVHRPGLMQWAGRRQHLQRPHCLQNSAPDSPTQKVAAGGHFVDPHCGLDFSIVAMLLDDQVGGQPNVSIKHEQRPRLSRFSSPNSRP